MRSLICIIPAQSSCLQAMEFKGLYQQLSHSVSFKISYLIFGKISSQRLFETHKLFTKVELNHSKPVSNRNILQFLIFKDLQYIRQIMYKDKSKQSLANQFFSNQSFKTQARVALQTSKNTSFQIFQNNSYKNFNTQPNSFLRDSTCPMLFNSNNKQNQYWKRMNSSQNAQLHKRTSIIDDTNKRQLSSERQPVRKKNNRSNSRPALVQKNSNLLNIQMDLTSPNQINQKKQRKLNRSSSLSFKKDESSIKKQENIQVFIRIKPKSSKQLGSRDIIQVMNQKTLKIQENYYSFDQIFNQQIDQVTLFQRVGLEMCQKLYEGFNGTIFAYGQTGSGKTYTIFGDQQKSTSHGLIYRCIRQILQFKQRNKVNAKIKCSMVQLYKQQLIDMFGSCYDLKIKENKNGQVYTEGLKQVYIKNQAQMINLVRQAAKGRKVSSTKLNEQSSRSHTILTIYLQLEKYTTKLCLIDLAGSQKVGKSGTHGQSFQEMKKINYSLSCLGNVINALTTRKKGVHIPFRDSKLTRLLKDSLVGNFLTSIIVNCSSSQQFLNETASSLKFAQRAKKIKVNVTSLQEQLNEKESISKLHQVIKKLQNDLQTTTNQLNKYKFADKSAKKDKKETPSSAKKIVISIPFKKNNQLPKQSFPKELQRCNTYESDNTARNPIPSERAHVQQNVNRYKQKIQLKPPSFLMNTFNIHDFSSLNVSKSIKKLENSPDISSLQLKYDQSPDFSLSFSIQGDSARRQVFLNSPS